jgi:hypothetical protein
MKYFTTASTKSRVRYNQISWTIGVRDSGDYPMPIGQANQVGKTADGLALWALRVKAADVPGRFIIVDGALIEVEPGPGCGACVAMEQKTGISNASAVSRRLNRRVWVDEMGQDRSMSADTNLGG